MAAPALANVAQQAAQQKLQDPAELAQRANKVPSKFDQVMQNHQAQGVDQASKIQNAQAIERLVQTGRVEQVAKSERIDLKKVNANEEADQVRNELGEEPGLVSDSESIADSPGGKMTAQVLENLEQADSRMQRIIDLCT